MLRTLRTAVDDQGVLISVIELRPDGPINQRQRPVVYGPHGDPLTDRGDGTFTNDRGTCYRLIA